MILQAFSGSGNGFEQTYGRIASKLTSKRIKLGIIMEDRAAGAEPVNIWEIGKESLKLLLFTVHTLSKNGVHLEIHRMPGYYEHFWKCRIAPGFVAETPHSPRIARKTSAGTQWYCDRCSGRISKRDLGLKARRIT
jgi:hypothetical protein